GGEKGRKHFFFEKKTQKTFWSWGMGGLAGTGTDQPSCFCFFVVHEKEDCSLRLFCWCSGCGIRIISGEVV
ncbi:hypothetical protein, partial [Acidiphilium sp.]|uniref:hypothetical protein n=1 Tax=Acidiphilium sp. TaxID=527 RepID=UPI00258326C1